MAKYGTFVKTEQFGNKFFCGKLVRSYKEPPIHFLEGKIFNVTPPLLTGFKLWWRSLCCVLGQGNLLSQSLFTGGTDGVKRYTGLASHPGGSMLLGNWFKPGGRRRRFAFGADIIIIIIINIIIIIIIIIINIVIIITFLYCG